MGLSLCTLWPCGWYVYRCWNGDHDQPQTAWLLTQHTHHIIQEFDARVLDGRYLEYRLRSGVVLREPG